MSHANRPLIPRDVLFGNPERTQPKISPDGKKLAYIAPDSKNVLQVWVKDIDQDNAEILTADPKRGIRSYFWAYDHTHLVYAQDTNGDENFHLFAVNVKTRAVKDLTPFPSIQARVIEHDMHYPDELLVAINHRNPQLHDIYRISLSTGQTTLDTPNTGSIIDWTADAYMQILAALATRPDGGYEFLYRKDKESPWESRLSWGPDEQGSILGFSSDGHDLFIVANHESNALRLLAINTKTFEERVIAQDPDYDVSDTLTHQDTGRVQAVAFNKDKVVWTVVDPSIADDFEALRRIRPGQFGVVSRDWADRQWVVACSSDTGPTHFYLYQRETKKAQFLMSTQPKLDAFELSPMEPISFKARDGLTLHGYLTVPIHRSQGLVPTVLFVHGGPWARDTWGFNSRAQWLADRGYAVLQLNYRGSTGYGKNFLNAGNHEWGGKMQDDLSDGVQWLIDQKIADPQKISIMGGSYGGYAALAAATFTPTLFCCAVDIVGPSNLLTLIQTIPPYWAPLKANFFKRVGNPDTEGEFLKSRSPFFFADRIQIPLLIAQGAHDPRVKQAESEQIVSAARKAGKPVEYIVYQDEGHGFARPENNTHFYAKAEEFLARYLGGHFEPMGMIQGHSAELK